MKNSYGITWITEKGYSDQSFIKNTILKASSFKTIKAVNQAIYATPIKVSTKLKFVCLTQASRW
nr:MAG: hypothetical protein DIU64_10875 [Caldicoprobacter oshimai]